jgi:hypothetical protein
MIFRNDYEFDGVLLSVKIIGNFLLQLSKHAFFITTYTILDASKFMYNSSVYWKRIEFLS